MDFKKLCEKYLGVILDFQIEEIEADGVFVKFDGKKAQVGGSTTPALARAYMLLSKAVSDGKKSFETSEHASFDMCGVMLDASYNGVPRPESVKRYLDYMALFGMNMLMLYTEDSYEVEGYPYMGYQRGRYSVSELRDIDDYAFSLGIEVIPCIQTLGHLEKLLKYGVYSDIAENTTVLYPGSDKTYDFIDACIKTSRLAFRSKRIHIGCDETRGLGFGKTFATDGYRDRFEIFNEHLKKVVAICRKYDFRPMMWSDMYFSLAAPNRSEDYSAEIEVPQYAIDSMPDCDMVFWDYYHDYNEFYRVNIEKHKKFNRNILFAGGIWLWNGQVPNFRYTYDTVRPAMEECLRGGIKSVFGTAWAYGDINHMLGLACLANYSEYCWRGLDCTKEDISEIAEFITKMPYELTEAISDFFCGLPGDYNVGKLVLWSDPLINLLCYDYDLEAAEKCFKNALNVFEKYPDAPYISYYKAVFRAAADKAYIQLNLHKKYKENDREWLFRFANELAPKFSEDFKNLLSVHHDNWHEDLRTQGFERLMVRYAGAAERIAYAGRIVNKFLNGEIDKIEALEPELIHGEKQKYVQPSQVMSTLSTNVG